MWPFILSDRGQWRLEFLLSTFYQEKLCAAPGPRVASVNLALHFVCSSSVSEWSGVCVRFVYPNNLQSCLHSSKESFSRLDSLLTHVESH